MWNYGHVWDPVILLFIFDAFIVLLYSDIKEKTRAYQGVKEVRSVFLTYDYILKFIPYSVQVDHNTVKLPLKGHL